MLIQLLHTVSGMQTNAVTLGEVELGVNGKDQIGMLRLDRGIPPITSCAYENGPWSEVG